MISFFTNISCFTSPFDVSVNFVFHGMHWEIGFVILTVTLVFVAFFWGQNSIRLYHELERSGHVVGHVTRIWLKEGARYECHSKNRLHKWFYPWFCRGTLPGACVLRDLHSSLPWVIDRCYFVKILICCSIDQDSPNEITLRVNTLISQCLVTTGVQCKESLIKYCLNK